MKSVAERLAAAELAMNMEAEAALRSAPTHLPGSAVPTRTHEEVVNLLDRLLDLGLRANNQGGGSAHPMLGTALRTVRRIKPEIVEALASAPEEEMKAFLSMIAREIDGAIDHRPTCEVCGHVLGTTPTRTATAAAEVANDGARAAITQGA